MPDFLHGFETIDVSTELGTISIVRANVIGITGTAAAGGNKPVLVTADTQISQFGTKKGGYSIPKALEVLFNKYQPSAVIVINGLTDQRTDVPDKKMNFGYDDTIDLAAGGIQTLVVKSEDGTVTYEAEKDYTLNADFGLITRVRTGAIKALETVQVSYSYADPEKVTDEDLVGGVDTDGNRTGMQQFKDCYQLFGMWPKLLISPWRSHTDEITTAQIALGNKLRSRALSDAPEGTSKIDAIKGRGPAGTINFNHADERFVACYPMLHTSAGGKEPLSLHIAGVMASHNYWESPSNKLLSGVTGAELTLSAAVNDPSCDVNMLNAVGIVTVFNAFGSGIRAWGNRNASFPSSTGPKTFICVNVLDDIIKDSIEMSALMWLDKNINKPLIDCVVEAVNALMRSLVASGAIPDGKCWYDPKKNPVREVANGHLTFCYDFGPNSPFERGTFEASININYLQQGGR